MLLLLLLGLAWGLLCRRILHQLLFFHWLGGLLHLLKVRLRFDQVLVLDILLLIGTLLRVVVRVGEVRVLVLLLRLAWARLPDARRCLRWLRRGFQLDRKSGAALADHA